MSEHDDIEKKLSEFREGRDRDLPADRRLLPVHKDRLLAEARRCHGPEAPRRRLAFFRPVIRWAMVAAPLLILALAGYLWFQGARTGPAPLRSENHMALLKAAKADRQTRKAMLPAKEENDAVREMAEATQKGRLSASEGKASSTPGPAAPPASAPVSTVSAETRAASNEPAQMVLLDLCGQHRSRGESKEALPASSDDRDHAGYIKDRKNAEKAVGADESLRGGAGGKSVSRFSNFKLVQSADAITLVDEAGSTYVGRLVQPQQFGNAGAEQAKTKTRQKQKVSNFIQQANLVGTNRMTREVVTLVANFYVEPQPRLEAEVVRQTGGLAGRRDTGIVSGSMEIPKPESKSPVPEKKQLVDKLQQAQSRASNAQSRVSTVQAPGRVNVVLERVDVKNNRQEQVADAERLDEGPALSP